MTKSKTPRILHSRGPNRYSEVARTRTMRLFIKKLLDKVETDPTLKDKPLPKNMLTECNRLNLGEKLSHKYDTTYKQAILALTRKYVEICGLKGLNDWLKDKLSKL